jgi:uncharacterized protein (DUF2147 family)
MKRCKMRRFAVLGLLLFPFLSVSTLTGSPLSPVGYWKTIDDKTGELKSIVKIWEEQGQLKGRIEKLFPKPDEDPNPKCEECTGERKDKPILGMVFLWKFVRDEDRWVDGKVLDPENGKIYHCTLKVVDRGRKLEVFGYIKIIFKIGRTQTWLRAEESDLKT